MPAVQRPCYKRQYSIGLEEGLGNSRAICKKRRTDRNTVGDLADDAAMRRVAWEREKLRPMEESADRSRRLDLENTIELKRFELEVSSKLKVKEMTLSAELREKELLIAATLKKEEMETVARLKLLDSLFADQAAEEVIDRHMRIFKKYNS